MKKHLFLAACLISAMFAMAQKETVEFYNMKFNDGKIYEREVQTLRDNLIAAFTATGRMNIVSVNQDELKTAKDTKNQYALTGTVTTFNVVGAWNSVNKYEYTATVQYNIRLYDLQKGTMIDQMECKGIGVSTVSGDESRARAIDNVEKNNIKLFIEKNFPIKGEIIAIADGNEKKVKSVYINLGSDAGISKGQKFSVYQLVDIAGEMSEKKVGNLTVTNVLSGTRSECSVKGGDVIGAAIKNGDQLIIKSEASAANKIGGFFGF